MIPYLIPIIISIFGIAFYDVRGHTSNRKMLYWCVCIYLIFLFGLRYQIGWDTRNYSDLYNFFPSFRDHYIVIDKTFDVMQPGFKLLWLLTRTVTTEFWFFQLVQCTFVNIVVMWFLQKHTDKIYTVLLFYLLCFSWYYCTEIMRESISISIFLLSYNSLVKRHWIKYYIGVFFAIMFHISAVLLIFVPILVIYPISINRKFFIISGLCVIVFLILHSNLISIISSLSGNAFAYKLLHYTTQYAKGDLTINWMIFRILTYVILPLITVLIYKYYFKEKIPYESFIAAMIIIGVGIILFQEICVRLTNYFRIFAMLSISILASRGIMLYSKKKLVSYVIMIMFLLLYIYDPVRLSIEHPEEGYAPYHSILEYKFDPIEDAGKKY